MTDFFYPFYYLRHGETDWNRDHRAMGQTDIPLNKRGEDQAKKAALILQNYEFSCIAVSPLQRALKTAFLIAEHIPRPIHVIDDFKEGKWGILEGKPKGDGAALQTWRKGEK